MKNVSVVMKRLTLTMDQLFAANKVILTAVGKDREYDQDNHPTDKVLGSKYTIVCPELQYISFNVKVPNSDPIITQDELDQAGGPIWITFENFVGRFYQMRGETGITCKADKAVLVTGTKARG